MNAMRLYFNKTSPYARKVRAAVIELGLTDDMRMHEVDPWSDPPELLTAAPLSKVPALMLDDGLALTESEAIVRRLDRLVAEPLLYPAHVADTDVRAALAHGVIDAAFVAVLEDRRPQDKRWDAWPARQHAAIQRALDAFENALEPPPERFDAGDLNLAVALGYLDFRHAALHWRDGRPRLNTWYTRIAQRPSLVATRPES
ncbi:MAG TPA: glutathione S-transferase family protein [Burkholderiaceae bacterium]|nr:glutathione S-transferase family protein [Burkholderiaceae bacterium]